ncbi:hypothetical protein GCM10007108_07240 [Thermogymnomonas acidicola]|uniref:O-antigen/teichoic acid export membrane protein n=2 Tax=Thermogymnomonas acidicola TaxID=399579 RepID=A0AA37BQU3_9ARCH|nr:hypothetical protein GCM10007108_07240 [Thermogymnomonas acidicola]
MLVLQSAVNGILGYIGLFFVTRFIGATAYGYLAFGMGFAGTLFFMNDLGFSQAHIRNISSGASFREANETFLAIKLLLGGIFVIVVISALLIWTDILHKGFQNPVEFDVILALIPYYFFQNMLGFSNAFYTARLHSARMSFPGLVEATFRNSTFIIIGALAHFHVISVGEALGGLILSIIYSVSYTLYFTVSYLIGRPWNIGRPRLTLLRSYMAFALPLAVSSSLSTVNGNIDKVIVQFFWHADATGAFYASQRIVTIITTMSSSLYIFFLPLFVRMLGSREDFDTSVQEYERIVSLFALPIVVAFIVMHLYITNLFTAAYDSYSEMLMFLSANAYIAAVTMPYSSALTAENKTWVVGRISIYAVIVNIALNLLLVPPSIFGFRAISLGATGASVSLLSATLFSSFLYRYRVWRDKGIGYPKGITVQAVPVAAQAAFLYICSRVLHPYDILILAPVLAASVIIYLGFAVLLRQITIGQIFMFIRMVNPKRIVSGMREER